MTPFSEMIEFTNEIMPREAVLPMSMCSAKTMMKELGLSYIKFMHARTIVLYSMVDMRKKRIAKFVVQKGTRSAISNESETES